MILEVLSGIIRGMGLAPTMPTPNILRKADITMQESIIEKATRQLLESAELEATFRYKLIAYIIIYT